MSGYARFARSFGANTAMSESLLRCGATHNATKRAGKHAACEALASPPDSPGAFDRFVGGYL